MTIVSGRGWTMHLGDCRDVLPTLDTVNHVITDPPYGEHVHSKPWQSKMLAENGDPRASSAHAGIDFDSLTPELRLAIAREAKRLADRWTIAFCDIEGGEAWRTDLTAAGLDYVRTCVWDKVDSSPQFSGDRPASAAELFCCAHQPGRKRWNGGGRRNVFTYAVNAERGGKPHPTTKPLALMLDIVELFTDEGEWVLDPFTGSGTTGIACLRLGRSFIGIESNPKYFDLACEGLTAEESGVSRHAFRAGQSSLFDLGPKKRKPKVRVGA